MAPPPPAVPQHLAAPQPPESLQCLVAPGLPVALPLPGHLPFLGGLLHLTPGPALPYVAAIGYDSIAAAG